MSSRVTAPIPSRSAKEEARLELQRQRLRTRQVRGLLWLAIIVLIASVLRAGIHNVFLPRWWRVW